MRLWADFNYMEELEDRLWANLTQEAGHYLDLLQEELAAGNRATLFDGLGYECEGTIMTVDLARRRVECKPDWSTLRPTRPPPRTFHFFTKHRVREDELLG